MPHDASVVRVVSFDRTTRTLRLQFEDGAVREYADVPEHLYDELAHASKPDIFFRAHIRNEFIGTQVGDVDLAEMAHERREDALLGAPAPVSGTLADAPATRDVSRSEVDVRASRHTWVVDVLEDDAAAVEVDGRRVTPMPRWLLPSDVHDGDVLRVTHARSAAKSTFTIEVDRAATQTAIRRSTEQMRDVPPGGAGDVDLRT